MTLAPLANTSLLRALARQNTPHTPVWIMRQAGRYLPEYRQLRQKAGNFMALCQKPELACEASLQPIQRFDLDAAILFSDILTIPDALGLGLHFSEGEGPIFDRPIRSYGDVDTLPALDMERLHYVPEAIALIQTALSGKVPLIGFSGSPWTLAVYMVEGGSSKDFRRIKRLLYSEPSTLHALLAKLADAVAIYLNAQIAAGVDVVQIFDTWGGVLGHDAFVEFDCTYTQRVISQLTRVSCRGADLPIIVFSKGCGQWLADQRATGASALGLDWTADLDAARKQMAGALALQGNIDPAILYAPEPAIKSAVQQVLNAYGPHPGHVFNLGHGIAQDVDPARLGFLIKCVHELSGH